MIGFAAMTAGSSPHVRGAHICSAFIGVKSGIIPACAGSTEDALSAHHLGRDHPRMCGEHKTVARLVQLGQGSSPHVRGAHQVHA